MASTTSSTGGATGGLGEELRGDAQTLGNSATQRIQSEIDARKGGAVSQVQSVSSAIGNAADQLGDDSPQWLRSALEQGARKLDALARTVEQKDARALGTEVQQMARQNPGTFLAGCAVVGFAAARVFKAGGTNTASMDQSGQFGGVSQQSAYETGDLPQPSFASQSAPTPEAVS